MRCRLRPSVLCILFVVACSSPDEGDVPSIGTTAAGTPGGTTGGPTSGSTTSTGTTTTTTPTLTPDACSGFPLSQTKLNLESSEDFTIGTDGMLYGVSFNSQALIRQDRSGAREILAPSVSTWGRGTRFLPGGDLVVAVPDDGTVKRFDTTTWSSTTIANGLAEPNGIAIGDDGMVYLTQMTGRVVRIDPDTGQTTELFNTPISTDGIAFAPDYRTLYWNSESGEVIKVVLDDYGNVETGPEVLANIAGAGGFDLLDGMTSDACGNLYVVKMSGQVVRVFPDGNQELFVDLSGIDFPFISAVNFGSGFGGFEETNMYVMDLNGGIYELETDIPRNWEPHL